jgi:hypothetical protein
MRPRSRWYPNPTLFHFLARLSLFFLLISFQHSRQNDCQDSFLWPSLGLALYQNSSVKGFITPHLLHSFIEILLRRIRLTGEYYI